MELQLENEDIFTYTQGKKGAGTYVNTWKEKKSLSYFLEDVYTTGTLNWSQFFLFLCYDLIQAIPFN